MKLCFELSKKLEEEWNRVKEEVQYALDNNDVDDLDKWAETHWGVDAIKTLKEETGFIRTMQNTPVSDLDVLRTLLYNCREFDITTDKTWYQKGDDK